MKTRSSFKWIWWNGHTGFRGSPYLKLLEQPSHVVYSHFCNISFVYSVYYHFCFDKSWLPTITFQQHFVYQPFCTWYIQHINEEDILKIFVHDVKVYIWCQSVYMWFNIGNMVSRCIYGDWCHTVYIWYFEIMTWIWWSKCICFLGLLSLSHIVQEPNSKGGAWLKGQEFTSKAGEWLTWRGPT